MNESVCVTGMSGAGNDFLVVGPADAARLGEDRASWARRVCRRGISFGCDGVVIVEACATDRVRVSFVNPDGSSAFCGNGSRCAARFAHLEGLAGRTMVLETAVGEVPAEILPDGVRLELSAPEDHGEIVIEGAGRAHRGRFVTAGIPHFVQFVDDPGTAPLEEWGPLLRRHAYFGSAGTNVNLASLDAGRVRLRTWERGVEGETLCCGSGAVAAAFAARRHGAPQRVEVVPASGIPVFVELPGDMATPRAAILEGEARVLFRGEIDPEAWTWPG
ncbi:MAG: diaminopimelate epimerase [Acidobacteria bacterium]|nr:diaminopimelate epimerase [Acidobacteriota bacterium]NIM64226.1 diaminopimelate epimerase [Acidobacteriota bacterium]NIO59224.1 diaminopimelate epimerase [Acidobacteriota bacterium]NIQ30251.1 diaminopimelate epimerase [Acidobacteriota bacterium]NIQ85179.1 diaminopimelate epimerase [Acidobacteriota bacterium]